MSTAVLTPTVFLERAAGAFGDRVAVIDGGRTLTYRELEDRASRLASLLTRTRGIEPGARVAALCANSHVMLEAHYGVPLAGLVLVPLNTRLSEDEQHHQLVHADVRCLIATPEFEERARALADRTGIELVLGGHVEGDDLDARLARAGRFAGTTVTETDLLSISYTSGTTGAPKGVMHTHRGAYLQTLSMVHHNSYTTDTRYLWTLPMFHCHGWANTWAITAAGGTHVCLRTFSPTAAWDAIDTLRATDLSAAPTVLTMMLAERTDSVAGHVVKVTTGGAPPSPALLERLRGAGFVPQHLYGLTETIGPSIVNVWHRSWDDLPVSDKARLHARQGVPAVAISGLRVAGPDGEGVARDATSRGEILLRGDTVTPGYFRNETATTEAIVDGWFHTGDVAVVHPDGYVEVVDRLKDIIISGGENISSVEVERVIDSFPGVLESAVVGAPDERWGERPVAFVDTGVDVLDEDALAAHLRQSLGGFKVPRTIVKGKLPKTATGKIRKDVLRRRLSSDPGEITGRTASA